jgi:hypothetical protein
VPGTVVPDEPVRTIRSKETAVDELVRKAARVDPAMGPGRDGAVAHGCRCSVLFNDTDVDQPATAALAASFVDPLCPLHGPAFDLERSSPVR